MTPWLSQDLSKLCPTLNIGRLPEHTFTSVKRAGCLRTRHLAQHFRRLALLDTLAQTGVSREVPPAITQTLVSAATAETDTRFMPDRLRLRQRPNDLRATTRTLQCLFWQGGYAVLGNRYGIGRDVHLALVHTSIEHRRV